MELASSRNLVPGRKSEANYIYYSQVNQRKSTFRQWRGVCRQTSLETQAKVYRKNLRETRWAVQANVSHLSWTLEWGRDAVARASFHKPAFFPLGSFPFSPKMLADVHLPCNKCKRRRVGCVELLVAGQAVVRVETTINGHGTKSSGTTKKSWGIPPLQSAAQLLHRWLATVTFLKGTCTDYFFHWSAKKALFFGRRIYNIKQETNTFA